MIEPSETAKQRQKAVARWDSEGGAGPDGPQKQDMPGDTIDDMPPPTDAELAQLRIRDMAVTISPRAGSTRHPLTIHAARQMLTMIERAEHGGAVNSEASQPNSGVCHEQN
jgi:hypothetical protein